MISPVQIRSSLFHRLFNNRDDCTINAISTPKHGTMDIIAQLLLLFFLGNMVRLFDTKQLQQYIVVRGIGKISLMSHFIRI